MVKRIVAIAIIYVLAGIAWMALGSSMFVRTEGGSDLKGRVESQWGSAQTQDAPSATYLKEEPQENVREENGRRIVEKTTTKTEVPMDLESSRIMVDLALEHRQKGLLWYSTYKVAFTGHYRFANRSGGARQTTFRLGFPATNAIYDDLVFTLDGKPLAAHPDTSEGSGGGAFVATALIDPGAEVDLMVGYKSQGLDAWCYRLGGRVSQVKDFQLSMQTDFADIDFPSETLSPTRKEAHGGGWMLDWTYANLVSGLDIGMTMPEKLQPGPLVGRISFFAPVSLFFFFFILFVLCVLKGVELHPMNYAFLAGAFFSFHLLMAYLVDHISIHLAFLICSLVSVFLVVSYLRLVVGMRFAAVEAGLAQFIYLVLFSYAFFFKGFTGLSVSIGAILTLFVVMQLTGRIRWSERFQPPNR